MNEDVGGGDGLNRTPRCPQVSPLGRARLWPARAVCNQADGRSAGRAALDVAKKHCMDIKKNKKTETYSVRASSWGASPCVGRCQRDTIWAGLSILGDPGRATA